jgi:hypothetical protein
LSDADYVTASCIRYKGEAVRPYLKIATRCVLKAALFTGVIGQVIPVHSMTAYEGKKVQLQSKFYSTLGGGKWSASDAGCFAPGGKAPVPTEQKAGWGPELF